MTHKTNSNPNTVVLAIFFFTYLTIYSFLSLFVDKKRHVWLSFDLCPSCLLPHCQNLLFFLIGIFEVLLIVTNILCLFF